MRAWDERFQGVKELTDRTVTVLRAQGIEVIEVHEWQLPSELGQAEIEVLIYEFQRDLNAWLEEFAAPEQARDMNAIIAYNQAHAERTLALFGQEYFEAAAMVDLAEAERLPPLESVSLVLAGCLSHVFFKITIFSID